MSITTYTELQTAIGNWLDHSLFTSRIPEFIVLFEATANRKLRVRQMETSTRSRKSDWGRQRRFHPAQTNGSRGMGARQRGPAPGGAGARRLVARKLRDPDWRFLRTDR
jgi:hypothetical protein